MEITILYLELKPERILPSTLNYPIVGQLLFNIYVLEWQVCKTKY